MYLHVTCTHCSAAATVGNSLTWTGTTVLISGLKLIILPEMLKLNLHDICYCLVDAQPPQHRTIFWPSEGRSDYVPLLGVLHRRRAFRPNR